MPKTSLIAARQLPEVRAELVQWLQDPGEHGGPETWAHGFDPKTAAQERQAAADWAISLTAADLFFVSADMTRLAVSAGMALPAYRLHPEDLPAPHGLLLWEEAVTDAHDSGAQAGAAVVAISWAVHGGGVHVRAWAHREEWLAALAKEDTALGIPAMTPAEIRLTRQDYPYALVCMFSGFLPFARIPGWLAAAPADTSNLSLADIEDHYRSATRIEQAERALLVTWLLMGQTLASEDQETAPRSSAKYIARIDPNLLTSVRYVRLRHQSIPQAAGGEGGSRGYQHRWIVRGHWRNHYYPSRQDHRPIWIAQHIKGPDGAPILDPGKLVNVLGR